jgi:hypothetical protein
MTDEEILAALLALNLERDDRGDAPAPSDANDGDSD